VPGRASEPGQPGHQPGAIAFGQSGGLLDALAQAHERVKRSEWKAGRYRQGVELPEHCGDLGQTARGMGRQLVPERDTAAVRLDGLLKVAPGRNRPRENPHPAADGEAALEAYVAAMAAAAPPLTSEQRDRLALLLRARHRLTPRPYRTRPPGGIAARRAGGVSEATEFHDTPLIVNAALTALSCPAATGA